MLPGWLVLFIYVGAIFAAFTSINGILATSPREVFALARDRVFPGWLALTSAQAAIYNLTLEGDLLRLNIPAPV